MLRNASFVLMVTVTFALAAAAAEAQPRSTPQRRPALSLYGGHALPRGDSVLAAGAGFPGVFVQYSAGVSDRTDVGVRADLLWSSPYSFAGAGTGIQLALPTRVMLAHGPRAAVALRFAPDVVFGDFAPAAARDGERSIALGVDAGVNVGVPVRPVEVVFGVTSPVHWVAATGSSRTDLHVPVAPYAGAEVRLTEGLGAFGIGQLGYDVHVPRNGTTHFDPFARIVAGLSVAV